MKICSRLFALQWDAYKNDSDKLAPLGGKWKITTENFVHGTEAFAIALRYLPRLRVIYGK